MLVGFDPNALTSISQAAEAAYLASGVQNTPGMLPSISRARRLGLRHRFGTGRHDVERAGDVDAAVLGRLQAGRPDGRQGRLRPLLRHAERG